MLAKLYFGMFTEVDGDLEPDERLVLETNKEIAAAAREGFITSLRSSALPSAGQIGEAHAESKHYQIEYVVLAGMRVLNREYHVDVRSLPTTAVQAALAFHYSTMVDGRADWVGSLISNRTVEAADGFEEFWRSQLARGSEDILGLYDLAYEDVLADVARRVMLNLLGAYPNCNPRVLDDLLRGRPSVWQSRRTSRACDDHP